VGGSTAKRFGGQRRVAGVDVVTVEADYVGAQLFEPFFAAEYGRVLGLAFALCGRRVVAEEVAQDAFVQAYRRWSVVSGYDDPGAWVRRVAVNLATSTLRRRAREARALARLAGRRAAEAELVVADEAFWEAVRRLPRRQAQCVALHYLEDRPVTDIAAVLGIAEATVRVHLHQGRAALAVALGEEEP
jgi:RNA polymerase sigma factor (sigma-70 family)